MQRRLAEANHQLLIATNDYSPIIEESQALNLLARGADALVLCGVGQRPSLQPPLTTVHVPAEIMWRRAADHVLALLDGQEPQANSEVEESLVVRGSTAPPPGARGRH